MQLVALNSRIADAILDQRYATTNNITNQVLYHDMPLQLTHAAAEHLAQAANLLRPQRQRLVIWDAYRPIEAQQQLRQVETNNKYVAENSQHCLGLAVDVTIATEDGTYLDMGTDFDEFTELAHLDVAGLTDLQRSNRAILHQAMQEAGFTPWPYEWWHFEYRAPEQ